MNAAVDVTHSTLTNIFPLILPEALLVATACVLYILAVVRIQRRMAGIIALVGLAIGFASQLFTGIEGRISETITPLLGDPLAILVRSFAYFAGAVLLLMAWDEVPEEKSAEYFATLLIAVAGTAIAGNANELIVLFLALEMISIPTYILLYLPKQSEQSQEATIKYFLLSIAASAVLLFGFSYLYGATGTTNISAIIKILPQLEPTPAVHLSMIAAVFIIGGMGFKVTAVPFHYYAPDVYAGGPWSGIALLAYLPKIAGFAALLRLFGGVGIMFAPGAITPPFAELLPILITLIAAITMTVGNVLALRQDNIRRLFAYSSIAHSGYLLIGIAVITTRPVGESEAKAAVSAATGVLFYLLAYGAMTLGAFALLSYLSPEERPIESENDLSGLGKLQPVSAALMSLFLFNLIGLPFTAGFYGKFLVFAGALAPNAPETERLYQFLVLIGAVNAAIGAYYYLRIVGVMYLREGIGTIIPKNSKALFSAVLVCAGVALLIGLYPAPIQEAAQAAAGQ